jgi:hypothetical protein
MPQCNGRLLLDGQLFSDGRLLLAFGLIYRHSQGGLVFDTAGLRTITILIISKKIKIFFGLMFDGKKS